MGNDGHVGSLYPKSAQLLNYKSLILPVVKKEGPSPITFSLSMMNSARTVVVSLTGEKKAAAVKHALETKVAEGEFPGAMVKPNGGRLVWMIDNGAASDLAAYNGVKALL